MSYYTINEEAARRANDMNSFRDYKAGSATAEYRRMVDAATELAERQKQRVDPMYHEKIDRLEEIAFDGVIDASERTDFMEALDFLRKLEESINDIILIGLGKEKAAPGATGSGQARK